MSVACRTRSVRFVGWCQSAPGKLSVRCHFNRGRRSEMVTARRRRGSRSVRRVVAIEFPEERIEARLPEASISHALGGGHGALDDLL
jgi:hypothetical protein